MNKIYRVLAVLFLAAATFAEAANTIVFVHIGPAIPDHTETAIDQARLFNPQSTIYLLANRKAIERWGARERVPAELVPCEEIPFTEQHRNYVRKNRHNEHFWRYTSERFLYLYDFVEMYQLENVLHMENDIMLYADIEELLPVFLDKYSGIAATFDNDERCIPGFVFIPTAESLRHLADCFVEHAKKCLNDMQLLAVFKNTRGSCYIDHLPIVVDEYKKFFPLISPHRHVALDPCKYSLNIRDFDSVFDAAALGQYLGGIDPRNGPSVAGFINESCVFNPRLFTYIWEEDTLGRAVPYMVFKGKKTRINNLHIHCKRLHTFSSTNPVSALSIGALR